MTAPIKPVPVIALTSETVTHNAPTQATPPSACVARGALRWVYSAVPALSLLLGAIALGCQQPTGTPSPSCPAPPAPHPAPHSRSLEIQDHLEAVMSATVCRYNDQEVERLQAEAQKRKLDAGEWASAWRLKERCRAEWWRALWRASLQQQLDAGWECTAEALTLGASELPKGITCTPPGGGGAQ